MRNGAQRVQIRLEFQAVHQNRERRFDQRVAETLQPSPTRLSTHAPRFAASTAADSGDRPRSSILPPDCGPSEILARLLKGEPDCDLCAMQ